ncbi:hypothetical protein SE951_14675 [Escherichia coli]|nr:hypothetical protein [Escherichia coli]STP79782.1 Uncharacterised protein [Escherichia coli]
MKDFFREYRDTILASVGIIVAVFSLYFTQEQSKEQIKHNHISVEPRINAYVSNDGRINKSGLYIINNGMGTAFVSNITVMVDGKRLILWETTSFLLQCMRSDWILRVL